MSNGNEVEVGPGYVGLNAGSNQEAAELAAENGCTPKFSKYYNKWYCDCEHGTHCCDQQCSVISMESAARKRGPECESCGEELTSQEHQQHCNHYTRIRNGDCFQPRFIIEGGHVAPNPKWTPEKDSSNYSKR